MASQVLDRRKWACTLAIALSTFVQFCVIALSPNHAYAGGDCHHCGCRTHNKPRLCLIRTYEEVEMPQYACEPEEVFFQHKGVLRHFDYRRDLFSRIERKCYCCCQSKLPASSHGDHGNWDPCQTVEDSSLKCTCWIESGCKELLGAKPTGCHKIQQIRTKVDSTQIRVPVMKWVKVCTCDSCGTGM